MHAVPDGVSSLLLLHQSYLHPYGEDQFTITSLDWQRYPILRFSETPEIEIELIDRPEFAPYAVGEISTIPTAAAIANAIFDATGKRIREVPFTPDRVRPLP
jgi:nicotinate dehydrogenase subunit B